jgi:hypothetical protein
MSPSFYNHGLVANSESTLLGRVDSEPRRAGGEGQIAACPIDRHADHAATPPRRFVDLTCDPPEEGGIR